jgi:hypothetical protein
MKEDIVLSINCTAVGWEVELCKQRKPLHVNIKKPTSMTLHCSCHAPLESSWFHCSIWILCIALNSQHLNLTWSYTKHPIHQLRLGLLGNYRYMRIHMKVHQISVTKILTFFCSDHWVVCDAQVLNGLLERVDWKHAIRKPLGIIPAGTLIIAKSDYKRLALIYPHYNLW